MYQKILEAMHKLGNCGVTFGVENSREGERQLQNALGAKLEQLTAPDDWSWHYHAKKEEKFRTRALTNAGTIAIDLMGRHSDGAVVAIELKYVTKNPRSSKPQDAYAFPYDVAKDCLKLDLLRAKQCEQTKNWNALPDPNRLQTYVIAMTNWPDFWEGRKQFGWSTDFLARIQPASIRFDGLIKTTGRSDKTVLYHKRHHIAFGQPWTGEWRNYAEQFRYMLLFPAAQSAPQWTHQHDHNISEQSKIIPFLSDEARQEWLRQYETFKNSKSLRHRGSGNKS